LGDVPAKKRKKKPSSERGFEDSSGPYRRRVAQAMINTAAAVQRVLAGFLSSSAQRPEKEKGKTRKSVFGEIRA
jgi:hypothetical protein